MLGAVLRVKNWVKVGDSSPAAEETVPKFL